MRKLVSAVLAVVVCVGCASKNESMVARTAADQPEAAGVRPPGKTFGYYAGGWIGDLYSSVFKPKKKEALPALAARAFGEIRQVNTAHNFVLISCNDLSQALVGSEFYSSDGQRETAILRVSSLRNNYFIIADILTGRPASGERVFKR